MKWSVYYSLYDPSGQMISPFTTNTLRNTRNSKLCVDVVLVCVFVKYLKKKAKLIN